MNDEQMILQTLAGQAQLRRWRQAGEAGRQAAYAQSSLDSCASNPVSRAADVAATPGVSGLIEFGVKPNEIDAGIPWSCSIDQIGNTLEF